jgi:hypothetical protein
MVPPRYRCPEFADEKNEIRTVKKRESHPCQAPNEMALSGRCIAITSISLGAQAIGVFEFWET